MAHAQNFDVKATVLVSRDKTGFFLRWLNARYRGKALDRRPELVGKPIMTAGRFE